MTWYQLVHDGDRILVLPEDRRTNLRLNCRYLGHIEGAYKLAQAIEADSFGRPTSLRGTAKARKKA